LFFNFYEKIINFAHINISINIDIYVKKCFKPACYYKGRSRGRFIFLFLLPVIPRIIRKLGDEVQESVPFSPGAGLGPALLFLPVTREHCRDAQSFLLFA